MTMDVIGIRLLLCRQDQRAMTVAADPTVEAWIRGESGRKKKMSVGNEKSNERVRLTKEKTEKESWRDKGTWGIKRLKIR